MKFFAVFIYFSYLFYLGCFSLLGFQTKIRRKRNSSTFLSFKPHCLETSMSSAVNVFVHAICKCSKKYLAQKVARFGSLGSIPMIQSPFNSSCVALQYEPGTIHPAVPELHAGKNYAKITFQRNSMTMYCHMHTEAQYSRAFLGLSMVSEAIRSYLAAFCPHSQPVTSILGQNQSETLCHGLHLHLCMKYLQY